MSGTKDIEGNVVPGVNTRFIDVNAPSSFNLQSQLENGDIVLNTTTLSFTDGPQVI